MKHIGSNGLAVCGAALQDGDLLVLAALTSDCEECRGKVMVGPPSQRGCEVRPIPDYDPDAVILEVRTVASSALETVASAAQIMHSRRQGRASKIKGKGR